MAEYRTDLLIIGSGPAGYTAGIYAARAGISALVVSGAQKGGQLMMTNEVENYPGFDEVLSGADLMERMQKQAENQGVRVINDEITEVDFFDHPFCCSSAGGTVSSSSLVLGASSPSWRRAVWPSTVSIKAKRR